MGSRALLYYITTTIMAAVVGIFMVLVIHPGDPSIKTHVEGGSTDTKVSTLDAILDIVRCLTFMYCTLRENALA
jgi:solute carrier family 1 (high affinity glutamate transporter) protein 2